MSFRTQLKTSFEEIIPNVFRYEGDCCAVYVLREDDRAMLIDLGSAAILDDLAQIGVRKIEAVILTHAHRDQCQGASRLAERGIPLHAPRKAEGVIRMEKRQDFRGPSPLLRAYPSAAFEPPHPLSEAVYDVEPGQPIRFGNFVIDVHPAPGHCPHQVAYLYWGDEHHVLFCGDELHSAGKIHEPYHLETDHYTGAGARSAADSLRVLRLLCPKVLCPSHGPVYRGNTWDVFLQTEDALERLGRLKDSIFPGCGPDRRLFRPNSPELRLVSDHVLSWLNTFFLLSDQGGALMFDCGNPFSPTLWEEFRRVTGGRAIEAVIITHIHCDHLDQITNLRRLFPAAEVWTHRKLAALVGNPHAFRRPWLAPEGIRVDRTLGEAETFKWQEYELAAYYFPGQTDFHACYETRVDDRHVLFSGDNFYPTQQWGGTGGLCGLNGGHPRNGWRKSIQLVMDIQPDWILCAHTHPFEYRREHFEAALKWTEEVARQMEAIAPDGNLERHHVPHFIDLFPYVQRSRAGETLSVTAKVANSYHKYKDALVSLVVPEGWQSRPEQAALQIAAETVSECCFEVETPTGAAGRFMLTLDVLYDGNYLGERAECYVDLGV